MENKAYVFKAVVTDTTPLVRNPEVLEILSDTVSWKVNVAITGAKRDKTIPLDGGIAVQVKKRFIVLNGLQRIAYPFTISLYTVHGRLVYSRYFSSASYNRDALMVPTPPFPSDMYIAAVKTHSGPIQRVFKGVVLD